MGRQSEKIMGKSQNKDFEDQTKSYTGLHIYFFIPSHRMPSITSQLYSWEQQH